MQYLSRAIVRSYPLAWRERYDDEVQALIDAGAIRVRDVLDLLRGCIRERVLSLYEPGRHISAFRLISGITLIAWLTTLLVGSLLVSLAPLGTGYLLKVTLGPFPEDVTDTLEWLYLPVFLGAVIWSLVGLFRLRSTGATTTPPQRDPAATFRWTLVAAYAVMLFHRGMTWDGSLHQMFFSPNLMMWFLLMQLREPTDEVRWPGDGLFDALGRLRSARYDLRWARMELERCEGLYEGRDPGPELRAARAEMKRLTGEEADALAALDTMGYHSRFKAS